MNFNPVPASAGDADCHAEEVGQGLKPRHLSRGNGELGAQDAGGSVGLRVFRLGRFDGLQIDDFYKKGCPGAIQNFANGCF
jgi:hypothetical protein